MGRIAERARPDAGERERIERPPMDGDRDARPDPANCFSRAPGIEVSRPKARPPAPDRQERDINCSRDIVHFRAEVGVSREIHARRASDPVAQRIRRRTERPSSSFVISADRFDADAADVESVAGRDLRDVAVRPGQKLAQASRDDDPRPSPQTAQRRQVQVIVMRVGDEDRVDFDVFEVVGDGVAVPVEKAQTIDEERVGENAHVIHLDENRRVPEVAKMRGHGPSLMRQ